MSFALHRATSVVDAVALAQRLGPGARFIAGGTDLIIQINRRRIAPSDLIDISRLQELNKIEDRPDCFIIGALTTHKTIERFDGFRAEFAALPESARQIGGHQVRNIATVGGNIANASPAADVVVALAAHNAELTLIGPEAMRLIPIADFLVGPGRTDRRPDELLVGSVTVNKTSMRSTSVFLKAGRRKAMEISVVCVAARLSLADDGTCRDAGIALGAIGATVLCSKEVRAALLGHIPDEKRLREAGSLAAAACSPISDVRASAEYRRTLVEILVPRALRQCVSQLAGTTV